MHGAICLLCHLYWVPTLRHNALGVCTAETKCLSTEKKRWARHLQWTLWMCLRMVDEEHCLWVETGKRCMRGVTSMVRNIGVEWGKNHIFILRKLNVISFITLLSLITVPLKIWLEPETNQGYLAVKFISWQN